MIGVFQGLPLTGIMSGILDAVLYGYAVGEISWISKDGEMKPTDIEYKPQEWFIFDKENKLKLRKMKHGNYLFEEGEDLPPYKFLLTQNKATYQNPYGEKVLSRCYWPVIFKRAGLEYWQLMIERYGMPYLIGRYPNTFTDEEKRELLENLNLMIQDNITIFEDTLGIEIKENPKYNVGELYENQLNFLNTEISKAVLTVTLTTEIQNTGSYKAAEIHKSMLEFLGVSDKKLIEKALNELIGFYCELNFGDIAVPKVKLNKKEAIVDESAERDKILSEIGVRFTREYFKKKYNLSEGDFVLDSARTTDKLSSDDELT